MDDFTWMQPLPSGAPVVREDFLVEASRGRRVIHVGFVDYPLLERRLEDEGWLHARIVETAKDVVGIDSDADGVRWARAKGLQAFAVDASSEAGIASLAVEPAEVVIAGEVIEHLDAPGPFLRAMLKLCSDDGKLVVTTPNAYRALNFFVPISRRELIHPDHVAWHSPHTLATLLRRNGWRVLSLRYYQNPPYPLEHDRSLARLAVGVAANAIHRVAARRRFPYWCDGLIAVAEPARDGDQVSREAI